MLLNEIASGATNRTTLLQAVERWIDGIDQACTNNVSGRRETADVIRTLTPPSLKPRCKVVYRSLSLPPELIEQLRNNQPIQLRPQGASSYSATPQLANWFFDEVLNNNAILIKKPVTPNAILDVNRLRSTLTADEQQEFELLAYGDDAEVIVLDTDEYLTIHPSDVVKYK